MFDKNKRKVVSFDSVNLSLSGMRYSIEYEIIRLEADAELTIYDIRYLTGGGTERVPEKTVQYPAGNVIEMLNECGVMKWDGFHGKHPRNVRDGEMFSFTAVVNGGEKIRADGSENFPENYHKLNSMFRELLETGDETQNGREDK